MPKKRPHRKSRFGCDKCKKRRVKCDERFPRCGICVNRNDECYYSRQPLVPPESFTEAVLLPDSLTNAFLPPDSFMGYASPAASLDLSFDPMFFEDAHEPAVFNSRSPLALPSPDLSTQERIPTTDAALMHHWCTRTCQTFSVKGADVLREHVGHEALRHEYLFEAVLAVTLLHMACETKDSEDVRTLVRPALQHQNRSLSGLRKALGNITPHNCDAVFNSSILIMVCGIVSPLLPSMDDRDAESTVECVLQIVNVINGISSILQECRHWISQGPLARILGIFEPERVSKDRWEPGTDMWDIIDVVFGHGCPQHAAFERAILGLDGVYRREHCAIVWLVRIDADFIDELRKKSPFALLIFMHWAVLLYTMDDMWWKRYSGSKLVEELSVVLAGNGETWDRMIRWCRLEVDLDS